MMGWKDELKAEIVKHMISLGMPVSNSSRNQYYGWLAEDWEVLGRHMRECQPDMAKCSWDDTTWTEFKGTFYEGDESENGVEVAVTCSCGQVQGRKWRMRESYGDLLKAITS